jgi:hypothetical protein
MGSRYSNLLLVQTGLPNLLLVRFTMLLGRLSEINIRTALTGNPFSKFCPVLPKSRCSVKLLI